jgi:transcriptional regulator with XRE-family HTH domain
MRRNLLLYQRALFLRKKKGFSYSEIQNEIAVAKSTLSGWLSGLTLSPELKNRINNKVRETHIKYRFNLSRFNHQKRQRQIKTIRVLAKQAVKELTDEELMIAGTMLYWAEGRKGGNSVEICNADPQFIVFIMHWFRHCLHIDESRFQAAIHFHEGQSETDIKKFWSNLSKIPLEQFNKSYCKPPGTGHRKHYLQWGVIKIRIRRSSDLYHQITGWRDGLIENIISGKQHK